MNIPKFEFGIVNPVVHAGRNVIVQGRCHVGPIKLGAEFTRARALEIQGILTEEPLMIWSDERTASMKVERITAYGHQLDELSEGLTAELELSGAESLVLKPNDVLDA